MKNKRKSQAKVTMTVKCVACGNKEKGLYTDISLCPKCGSPMLLESMKVG